ncbi:MAG: hypothetical protein AB1540_04605 [Bdellovibrionota bacterium]
MVEAEDVFDPKQFQSIRLEIEFKDLTTGTEVRDHGRISLQEISEKTLVLEVPEKSCNARHNVMIKIKQPDKKQKKGAEFFSVTGKVIQLEEAGEASLRVTVEILQFDDKSWNDFQNLFLNRQTEIENFLKAAKGY